MAESLIAAGLLFGMDAFAHRKLTVLGFAVLLAGWVVCRVIAEMLRTGRRGGDWGPWGIELGGPFLWLLAVSPWLKVPWTIPQSVYAAAIVFLCWHGWRRLVAMAAPDGVGEGWRLLLVAAVAVGATTPFITDRMVGGTDASWYTGVHFDFLDQLRSGVFPVFVGQGDYAFNGSVNLFRTAPLCLWIAGLADVLTAQALSPIAVRNLGIVVCAVGAGMAMYYALAGIWAAVTGEAVQSAAARWAAALGAVLYVLCPAVLLTIYFYELQMTYTALLALPLVFFGNARTLLDRSGRGYVVLGVGLALTWYAHAPLAIISTLGTAAIQLGRFILEPAAVTDLWKRAGVGAVVFALLSAYYFVGMTELPATVGSSPRKEATLLLGIILSLGGAVSCFVRRKWIGGLAGVIGVGLAAWAMPVWCSWIVAWFLLFGLCVVLLRWLKLELSLARLALVATGVALAAAAFAQEWSRGRGYVADDYLLQALAMNQAARADLFRPLQTELRPYGSCQPGLVLWLLLGFGFAVAWFKRSLATSLVLVPVALLLALVLGVPGISEFVVGYAPAQVGNLVTLPMLYRLVPVLAAGGLVAAFLGLASTRTAVGPGRWWLVGALAVGVCWSGWEARHALQMGFSRQTPRAIMMNRLSLDTYTLSRYSYLMLRMPRRFIDGKQFHWLETRLLDAKGGVVVGPKELAAKAEAEAIDSEVLALTSRMDENTGKDWLFIGPGFSVQPGEKLILRFEIMKDIDCSGWLILQSAHGYLEFKLDPAYTGTGFGLGEHASSVTAVTNLGPHTEDYSMQLKIAPANSMPRDGKVWGRLHVSRYRPEQAPIEVLALCPFRARVQAGEAGWLETPRQWLAGYRATVDGVAVEPVPSRDNLVAVPVSPGEHEVVLVFAGSFRLWAGFLVSGVSAVVLLGAWLAGGSDGWLGWRASLVEAWQRWRSAQ